MLVKIGFEIDLAVRSEHAVAVEREFREYLEAFDEIGSGRGVGLHDLDIYKANVEVYTCDCELCEMEKDELALRGQEG